MNNVRTRQFSNPDMRVMIDNLIEARMLELGQTNRVVASYYAELMAHCQFGTDDAQDTDHLLQASECFAEDMKTILRIVKTWYTCNEDSDNRFPTLQRAFSSYENAKENNAEHR